MRIVTALLCAVFVGMFVACAGGKKEDIAQTTPELPPSATVKPLQESSQPVQAPKAQENKQAPTTPILEFKFGDQVHYGDLIITIEFADSDSVWCGQYLGRFSPIKMMVVKLSINNTGKGKIVNWAGWQGKAKISDEHGNKFEPLELRGWSFLPMNNTFGDGWDGDFGARVHPGTTYVNALYYEYAPPTSRQIIVEVPLDERVIRFSGPSGSKEKVAEDLENAKALEAKKGMILNVADLIKDFRAGRQTMKTDYPRGCTMKGTGTVFRKVERANSDIYRIPAGNFPYIVYLCCDRTSPKDSENSLIYQPQDKANFLFFELNDKATYDGLRVGEKVTVQGTLHVSTQPNPQSPNIRLLIQIEDVKLSK